MSNTITTIEMPDGRRITWVSNPGHAPGEDWWVCLNGRRIGLVYPYNSGDPGEGITWDAVQTEDSHEHTPSIAGEMALRSAAGDYKTYRHKTYQSALLALVERDDAAGPALEKFVRGADEARQELERRAA